MKQTQTFPFLVALEHSHVPSAVLLPETGKVTWLNSAAKALIGDCRGKKWDEANVLPPEVLEESRRRWNDTISREINDTLVFDTVVKTIEGQKVAVSASQTKIDAGGIPVVFRQFYPRATASQTAEEMKLRLSPRQLEILRLIARGETNEEISQALDCERNTVRSHVRRILGVLRVKSRAAAVALAYQEGLL